MTLQALSGGRFVAGLGSGSTPKDFEATGVDFADRFRLLRDYTAKIKALLNGETVDGINIHPWPNVKGGPPIVIGAGQSDPWIKRAADEYDGWMASGFSGLAFLREGARRYRDLGGTGRVICATVNVDLRAPYEAASRCVVRPRRPRRGCVSWQKPATTRSLLRALTMRPRTGRRTTWPN